jgi:hypothetical protein
MVTPLISVLTDGERLDGALMDSLSHLEVRESDVDPTVATLRFRLVQHPTGTYSPLDDDIFNAGEPLAVEIAAPGGLPQRLFDGVVTHLRPHFEEIEANCYLEVLAMDAAVILDAEERIAAYPDMSDQEAAEQILNRYQIPLVSDTTATRQNEDEQLLVQRGTDWTFLKRLSQRNGYVVYFEYDRAQESVVGHFHRPRVNDPPQADLTILRENQNLTWIDFQLTMTGPIRHVGAAIAPIKKQIIRADENTELAPMGEDGLATTVEAGLQEAGATAAQVLLRDPFPLDTAINAAATGATDLARLLVEARGELDPALYRGLLRARLPVLVKGVGARFSGVYYVRSVRSVLQEGQLTQTFIAVRNALGQSGLEDFGQDAEEVPPE